MEMSDAAIEQVTADVAEVIRYRGVCNINTDGWKVEDGDRIWAVRSSVRGGDYVKLRFESGSFAQNILVSIKSERVE